MCIKCWEAAVRLLPDMSEAERCRVLMEETCFPFGTPEEVERQLEHFVAVDHTQLPTESTP